MKTQLYKLRRAALSALLGLAAIAACGAQEDAARSIYSTRAECDWKERVLRLEVELDLSAAGLKLPEGRLDAERMMERDLAGLAKDAVFALQADSRRTIEDAISDGTLDPERLVAIADLAKAERSSFSKDMRKFSATYALGLDALSSLFLSGARPSPIRAPLEERPTRDYTGIVIYAKGPLPVHGEGIDGAAAPCLFPRVFDGEMRLLLDKGVVAPEVLARSGSLGGVLGYASGLGVEARERVGGDPMRVMAVELFGDDRCDYVISREDALRILSSPVGRELLRLGRVVVVLDL
jgi:hypothetical protein